MLYKCNSCDYYSNRKFNLQIHVQRKHANENLEIEENVNVNVNKNVNENANAIVNASSENLLYANDPNVHVENSNKCEKCGKCFSSGSNLNKHSKICKGVADSLRCEICLKVFSTRQGKYQHMKKKIKKCKPPATVEEKVKSTEHDQTSNV